MGTIHCKEAVLAPRGVSAPGTGGVYLSALRGRAPLQESFKPPLRARLCGVLW